MDEYSHSINHIVKYLEYGGIIGMIFGGFRGARATGLRFYLEHQQYKMVTKQDWYIYFKTKNYVMLKGFMAHGIKMGCHVGLACMAFAIIEQGISRIRQVKEPRVFQDLLNTCISAPIFILLARGFYNRYYRRSIRI